MATRAASGTVLAALADPARAVGRLGRPGWLQQHDHGRVPVGDPGGAPDTGLVGQPLRTDAALRRARARHGRHRQRHRARGTHPPLRRHLPGVQRLHAALGPAGRPDGPAHGLRVDPRLHRRRRGRPHPPAGRAPCGPAGDPGSGGGPTSRRQRDRRRLGGHPGPARRSGRPGPDAAERPGPVRAGPTQAPATASGAAATSCRTPRCRRRCSSSPPAPRSSSRSAPSRSWPRTASPPAWSPCRAWSGSPTSRRRTVTPSCRPEVRARVAVEAGVSLSWYRWVGDAGRIVGIDHYGASADQETLFQRFGLTVEAVVAAARASLADRRSDTARAAVGGRRVGVAGRPRSAPARERAAGRPGGHPPRRRGHLEPHHLRGGHRGRLGLRHRPVAGSPRQGAVARGGGSRAHHVRRAERPATS